MPSPSPCSWWKRLSALSTSEEPEPGTSKPPLVRCLVCWLISGTEATTSSSHVINTSFLRVRTNAESRFMAACIRAS